jgi:hypothetical protein
VRGVEKLPDEEEHENEHGPKKDRVAKNPWRRTGPDAPAQPMSECFEIARREGALRDDLERVRARVEEESELRFERSV